MVRQKHKQNKEINMKIETIKTINLEYHNTTITVGKVISVAGMKLDRNLFNVKLKGEHIIKNQDNYSNLITNECFLNDVIENLIAIDGGDEDVNACLTYQHEPIHWETI